MALFGVIGAGGFGREVMPLAVRQIETTVGHDATELVFVVEDAFPIASAFVNGHRVLTLSQFLTEPASERRYSIAIGDASTRARIAASIPADAAQPFSVVAETHVSLAANVLGDGAILCSFSHITSNTRIGTFFNAHIYSSVAHDCTIGDFVTFGPGALCNGHVHIEDYAYIGAGAVIRDGTKRAMVIGKGAVIGMGAVVTKSVAPGVTVVGNPARPLHAT